MPLSLDGAALLLRDDDDVAVALRPLEPGVPVRFPDTEVTPLVTIPTGHKIAMRAVAPGALVQKYGQPIGRASAPIAPGEHVHVHNVDGVRGRGDLAEAPR
jgi:hypothetical protein